MLIITILFANLVDTEREEEEEEEEALSKCCDCCRAEVRPNVSGDSSLTTWPRGPAGLMKTGRLLNPS